MLGTDPTAESNAAAIDGALVPSVTIEDGRLYLDLGFFRDNVNGLSDGAGSGGLPLGVTAQQTADLVTWTEVPFEDVIFGSVTASASVPVNGGRRCSGSKSSTRIRRNRAASEPPAQRGRPSSER